MNSILKSTLIGLLLIFGNQLFSQDLVPIPVLRERVTDLSGIINPQKKSEWEGKLEALEKEKGSQVAILILPSTQPETIEQYSIRVVDEWKLGRKGADDGVLLLFAMRDRKMRIEVGYGLEGAIPDAITNRIINQLIVPEFKAGRFEEGIEKGMDAVISIIRNEELPEVLQKEEIFRGATSEDEIILLAIFGGLGSFFLLVSFIITIRIKPVLSLVIGIITFVLMVLITSGFGSLRAGLGFGAFFSGIVSFFIAIGSAVSSAPGYVSRSSRSYGYTDSGSGWGGGGSFGGGGFGGGGFGGGGGGFGGGGSSGSW